MYKWLNTVLCIFAVTPHAGVRIEIAGMGESYACCHVTPHAGVRIEIRSRLILLRKEGHPPRGGAN